jgi:hypothetical protein
MIYTRGSRRSGNRSTIAPQSLVSKSTAPAEAGAMIMIYTRGSRRSGDRSNHAAAAATAVVFFFATSTSESKVLGSSIAISESILRLSRTPARWRPLMKSE